MPVTNEFLVKLNNLSIGRGTPLDPAKMFIGLTNYSGSLLSATIESVVAQELAQGNGYSRQPLTFTLDSVYDSGVDNRAETATVNVTFTAAGGPIGPFSAVFLIVEGSNRVPITFVSTDVNIATNTITKTGHGFPNGATIALYEPTAGYPGGLTGTTKYLILNATANTFQLAQIATPSTPIDITSQGSGTIKMADATGILRAVETTQATAGSASITIADAQNHTLATTLTSFR